MLCSAVQHSADRFRWLFSAAERAREDGLRDAFAGGNSTDSSSVRRRVALRLRLQVIIYLDNLCTLATQDSVRPMPVAHLAGLAGRMSANTA